MDFIKLEKPLVEIANKLKELKLTAINHNSNNKDKSSKILSKIKDLETKFEQTALEICKNLTPYQIAQISRHPNRPHTTDIIAGICKDFIELHGDRTFMDDKSIIGGLGILNNNTRIVLIGHQKGRNTKENLTRNFGMPHPEGYRKALRLMELAERFSLPIITLIDTSGAYPGKDAEERGQSEAIAKNIMVMSRLSVPIITVILGEGGSGGALAIAVANRVLMLEFAIYSVISPEGCASILWKDASQASKAAALLGITAEIALKNKVIDEIIKEPPGGAHWNHEASIQSIKSAIETHLKELQNLSPDACKSDRMKKYFNMGSTIDKEPISPFRRENPVAPWQTEWHENS